MRPKLVDATPSPAVLLAAARGQLVAMLSALDDVEVVFREKAVFALTGGPTADFNLGLVDDSPNLASVLADSVVRFKARGLPGLFMLSSAASSSLGERIDQLGLVGVGEAPLMAFSGDIPEVTTGYEVVRVTDSDQVHEVADLLASSFVLDRAWVGRTFASHHLVKPDSLTAFYLARMGGRAMSTVTTSGIGEVVGIWSMATPPDRQRRGAGKAALLSAMAERRAKGAQVFYLIATPEGKPLYDAVGFTTVETLLMFAPAD